MPEATAALPDDARELLRQGRALIDTLGAGHGRTTEQGVRHLEAAGASAGALLKIHDGIVPLLQRLAQPGRGPRWWQRFTGESMERQLMTRQLHEQLDELAARGESVHAALQRDARALADHDAAMAAEREAHERDLQLGRLLLDPRQAQACQRAGLDGHDMERLARRVANLESIIAATELTRRQYRLALQHAHVAADRYQEVRTLVLPLLKQADGFKNFNARLTAADPEGEPR